jgi:superfamily II DNA or RNA helicase
MVGEVSRRTSFTIPMFDESPLIDVKPPDLRAYQERCIRLIRMHTCNGIKSILVSAPTRSGKTVIISAIVRTATVPVLFLAHRMELLDQCAEELRRAGLTNVGIIRANDERANPSASVQVASIATLARRDKPWMGEEIIIIIDEAHRAASDSYRDLLTCYPNAIIIGFTATPCRLDGKPLGDLFQVLEVAVTYQELLKNPNYLLAPYIFAPPLDDSLLQIRGYDFDEDQSAVVMDKLSGNIVDHWLKRAHKHPVFNAAGVRLHLQEIDGPRRRTFLFACNIAHSMSLCTRFEKAGVRIGHLDGKTSESERKSLVKALASGELEILSNVNILLEGVNVPEAKCVVHARPTQSLTLWRQSATRVLTPWTDPTFGLIRPLILDHAGNTDRLDPPHIDLNWSLASKPQRRSGGPALKLCKSCFAYVEVDKTLCPHCGNEFKRGEGIKNRRETDEELQMRSSEASDIKFAFFQKNLTMAKSKGFKPGFAAFKYKEHYGQWPPREWNARAKHEFSTDKLWQEQLARREKRKTEREAQERAEIEHMEDGRERDELLEKLRKVQALQSRTDWDGERDAASNAADAIRKRLDDLENEQRARREAEKAAKSDPYNVRGAWDKKRDAIAVDSIASAWGKKKKPTAPGALVESEESNERDVFDDSNEFDRVYDDSADPWYQPPEDDIPF